MAALQSIYYILSKNPNVADLQPNTFFFFKKEEEIVEMATEVIESGDVSSTSLRRNCKAGFA